MSPKARALCASDDFCSAGEALVGQMFKDFTDDERAQFMRALKRVEVNLEALT
jgi:hypothetical protein